MLGVPCRLLLVPTEPARPGFKLSQAPVPARVSAPKLLLPHFASTSTTAARCLTPRSSGAPTAGHQARSGGTQYIFASPGPASCRRRPLSSNVRRRSPPHPMLAHSLLALALLPSFAMAQADLPKAIVAVVGNADRFNIGQDGYCGKRTEIDRPNNASFKIPAEVKTYFFVRASIRDQMGLHFCEADFSFTPQPSRLHIIRYSIEQGRCNVQVFNSLAGTQPEPFAFEFEAKRSCLLK